MHKGTPSLLSLKRVMVKRKQVNQWLVYNLGRLHHRYMNRLFTRSQFKPNKTKSSNKRSSSAPTKQPRVPKQVAIIPPSYFTPIMIEELKDSSSSASSTSSESPPPSPKMGDRQPPPALPPALTLWLIITNRA
ncbi:hypothetical protein LINPERPRIM_LOCUS22550 [Linum perenne]